MKGIRDKLLISIVLIVSVVVFGTLGYMVIEGWNFRDSLFMTFITITTVGYQEVHDLSPNGEIFTIFLLILGVGIIFYILSLEAKVIVEGQLKGIFERRKLKKKIDELKNHYIICGYGRMGKTVAKELFEKGMELVVIEKDKLQIDRQDILWIEGDATADTSLRSAGIDNAKGIVSVLPTDAENLFLVLSARELNPNILIVTRAKEPAAEKKLLRAGANRVVSPYHTGSVKIANLILKPTVVDFLEFATQYGNYELQLEEIIVQETSKFVNKTLEESAIGRDLRIIIVAIKKHNGDMQFNPSSKNMIEAGDTLIALGEINKLTTLEKLAVGAA